MGLRLKKELDARRIKGKIAPTPRQASTCCGISLIVDEPDLPMIRQVIEDKGIQIEKVVSLEKKDWQYRSC